MDICVEYFYTAKISGTSTHTNYFDSVVKELTVTSPGQRPVESDYSTDQTQLVNVPLNFFSSGPPALPNEPGNPRLFRRKAGHYTATTLPVKLFSFRCNTKKINPRERIAHSTA
jgi:hypothetical protein